MWERETRENLDDGLSGVPGGSALGEARAGRAALRLRLPPRLRRHRLRMIAVEVRLHPAAHPSRYTNKRKEKWEVYLKDL